MAIPPNAWPAFLGQGASTIDPASIPDHWGPTENIAWQASLPGKGQSSPVIWGDHVFVTSIEGTMKETCHIVALSLTDGRELWRTSLDSVTPVRSTYTQSRSAPTPTVDSERVYVFFETGAVAAYSHSGKLEWKRALPEEYGEFESTIGLASSPILVDNKLILLIDHEGPSYLLALNCETGETCWKTDRTSRSSYASPAIVPVAGKPQIVCSSSGSVDGYSPSTGEQLWTYEENVGGNRTGAPVAVADGVFAVAASPGMHNEREEQAKSTNFLMKVDFENGVYTPRVLWYAKDAMSAYNSPLIYRGYGYWINKSGVVYCFNAQTGENVYTKRSGGVCWTTPVGIGDRVYLFGKDGLTTVIATGPEYKVVCENQLWDPAVAGRDARASRGMNMGNHGEHGSDSKSDGATSATPNAGPLNENSPDAAPSSGRSQSSLDQSVDQAGQDNKRASQRPSSADRRGPTAQLTESEQQEAIRFADPVQYGVAIVNGNLVIRTGDRVYCIRRPE
ncbi:MAG: PQQ-binding-like beta-propeller repeat protein [Pirellulales bacterium]